MVASKQTRLKMRRGFVAAPLSYKRLMNHQFTDDDMKIITKGLVVAINPTKARLLLPCLGNMKSKWMLRAISHVGDYDVQLLFYKGLAVALYFKRPLSVITPEPEDPAPEGCLENEDDAWVRMELSGKSPRQLVGSVAQELSDKDEEIQRLHFEVEAVKKLLEVSVKQITRDLTSHVVKTIADTTLELMQQSIASEMKDRKLEALVKQSTSKPKSKAKTKRKH